MKKKGKTTMTKTKTASKVKKVATNQFQEVLEKKRDDILKMVTHNEENLTRDVGDEADVASQTFERELLFEMEDGERVILDDIEAALRKIEKGEFGICESCRKGISVPRLKAMPWARYCISCQARAERPS
jgi:DnaK suppressor protein